MADGAFHRFESLFAVEEGRLGVVVTFLGLLTLAKEQLVDIVQEAPMAPIYVKSLATGDDAPHWKTCPSEFDDDGAANDSKHDHAWIKQLVTASSKPPCWPPTSR